MATKQKQKGKKKAVVQAVEQAVEPVVVEAPAVKVTKRSAMLTSTKLALGDKPARNRADHIKTAFDAVAAILPATAAACLAVLEEHGKANGMNPNGTQASYLTYWVQRQYLKEVTDK
jgi:hypothetical protein